MNLASLTDLEGVANGWILARLDLNVPVDGGEVQDDTRIIAALPTLRWLADRAHVVAACSHLGKAKGTLGGLFGKKIKVSGSGSGWRGHWR